MSAISRQGGIGFNAKGAWSGTTAYNPGDVVTNAGAAYLNYASIAAPGVGAPTVASAFATHQNGLNTSTIAVAVTSTQASANGVLVLIVQIEEDTGGGATVSSVADTGTHTWTKRFGLNSATQDVEIWTAPCAAAGTFTVTATFSQATGGNNTSQCIAFALDNVNQSPIFDPQAGLPLHNLASSGALSLTTSYAHDFLLSVGSDSNGNSITDPAGWTNIAGLTNSAGLNVMRLRANYQIVNVTQSGLSILYGGTGGGARTQQVADAIQGVTAPSNPAPASDPNHWI